MLIGIDGNEANVENRVGIGEYSYELLKQFYNFQFSIFNFQFLVYLKDKPRGDLPKEKGNWQYRVIGPKRLWTQFALPIDLYLHRPRPDVFFSPTHYAPRFSPIPTVISIMDLSYIHFPEMFKKSDLYQLRDWTAYSIRNAKRILTISKASKDDIIKVYGVSGDKVIVIYPGIKFGARNPKSEMVRQAHHPERSRRTNLKFKMQNAKLLKEKYGIKGDYILFVGTLQPRKNIVRLIEAFSHVILIRRSLRRISRACEYRHSSEILLRQLTDQNDISLVVVGKKGWLYKKILEAPKKFDIEDKVKFLDFVPDEDLPLFYKNAIFFVLPSLYEGFGLPILEAMKYGCPVVTSNVSSLPEAGGEAALYVDPESVDDIVSKMALLIKDEKLRREMVGKGYKQVKKFSWEKTAKETLSVLTKVANDK